ncbi:MAG: hypothetical protein KKB22_00065, partial [Candidatus Omnitrophica bacterium]|nr:hypothetical protein [Candidatus Omnitrophota bacterium]
MKTNKAKRFWIQSMVIGFLYSGFIVYIAAQFGFNWSRATGNPAFFILSIIPAIIFFPLGYLSIKEFGIMFVSWLKMRREKIAILMTYINPWPKNRIRKLLTGIFIDEKGHLCKDSITGDTYVDLWNENIEHLFNETHITEEERNNYKIDTKGKTEEEIKSIIKEISLNPPQDRDTRVNMVRLINSYYKQKPGVDNFDKLLSLSVYIMAGGGEAFYNSFYELVSLMGREEKGEDTQLHHLSKRYANQYVNLMKLLYTYLEKAKILNTDEAIIRDFLKDKIEKIEFGKEIATKDIDDLRKQLSTKEAKAVLQELLTRITKWGNVRLSKNWRWLRSWTYVKKMYRKYAEHYYYDAIYQAVKKEKEGQELTNDEKELLHGFTREEKDSYYAEVDGFYEQKVREKLQVLINDNLIINDPHNKDIVNDEEDQEKLFEEAA